MQKLSGVLLIDDDSTTNFLNELLVESLGLTERLLVASTGEEALGLLSQPGAPAPALILLDVNMPGMNGIQFLENYYAQGLDQQQASVVVMLTTTMDARDLSRINELHIAGLVSKPLTKEKVDSILQLHFQRSLAS